jgi:hypothetical protein
MTGVNPRYVQGPVTYQVVETIVGGQLVEARAGGVVGVAAAASVKCIGVATKDATVAPAGATPDARTVVGYCAEPNGVVFATQPVGLAKITV